MAAIFDVGLKCASPKTILEMMTDTKDLTPDHIKSHLQKYRLHREKARAEFLGQFGRPLTNLSRDPSASSLDTMGGGAGNGSGAEQGGAAALRSLAGAAAGGEDPFRGQMGLIRDCIQMQAGFQSVLRQALVQQTQLQQQLQAHLQALGFDGPTLSAASARATAAANAAAAAAGAFNEYGQPHQTAQATALPTIAEAKGSHSQQQQARRGGGQQQQQQHGGGGGGGGKRSAEELMQAEMREHMDMHRQLVLRKNAQVSQYEAGMGPGGPLGPGDGAMALMPPAGGASGVAVAGGGGGGGGGGPFSQGGLPMQQRQEQQLLLQQQQQHHQQQHQHHQQQQHQQQQHQQQQHQQPPHGALDLDVDLSSFRWNEDEDNLFSFLMDPR